MNVIRTFVPGSFENYNHLVYCRETREAAAIDPFDAHHIVKCAQENNLKITQIWITHEHGDHIRQLSELKTLTNTPVYAPNTCKGHFESDNWLADGEQFQLGNENLKHFLTPGHIPGHGIYVYENSLQPELNFAICGDNLFNAGIGNTRSGNTETLYITISRFHELMTPSTRIYTGHDYFVTNLKFTLNHCPNFELAKRKLDKVITETPDTRTVATWEEELSYNLFLRLDSQEVRQATGITVKDNKARFIKLRQLRDNW